MPKHASRSRPGATSRRAGKGAARRAGLLALSGLWMTGGAALAVTPLNTYFGPGLPLDNYFPQGIPGTADQPGVTVLSRDRPQYNAQGVRAGAFIIRPGIDEQAGYNSNVVGGALNGKASSFLDSSGSVSVNSDYTRDNFGLTAGVYNATFFDVPRQSHTDYNVSFGGGLDIGRDQLYGTVSYINANEEPYDIGAYGNSFIQLNKPLNFSNTDFRVSYTTQPGRFILTPNVDYQLLRFAHGDFIGVAPNQIANFNQSLRDADVLQGGVIGRYEFQPQREAVLVLNGNYDHYIRGQKQNLGIVDSTGATVLGGLNYELNGAITVRALAGYQQRFFNGRNVSNQGAPIGEADIIWNPTGLTTVTGRYARTIEDATTESVTGYTYDRLTLIVDHELYRNILLQAHGRYENANYQNSNSQQTNFGVGAGATYLVNRNIQVALSYEFIEHQTSNNGPVQPVFVNGLLIGSNGNFGQHTALLHVRFGL